KSQEIRDRFQADPHYLSSPADARKNDEEIFAEKSAAALMGIGETSFRLGRFDDAREAYAKALAVREGALQRRPDDAAAKRLVARASGQVGYTYMVLGDLEAAPQLLARAVTLLEPLAAADPDHVDDQRFLALAHYRLGILKQIQGDQSATKEHFETCLKIRAALAKDESNVSRQREYLLALARCGDRAGAQRVGDELIATNTNPDVELLLDLACAFAQCSVAVVQDPSTVAAYRANALSQISQAVKAG